MDLNKKSQELALVVTKLAESLDMMGQMNRKIQVPNQSRLFIKLAKVLIGHSMAMCNSGELIKTYIAEAMKVQRHECETVFEIVKFKEQ